MKIDVALSSDDVRKALIQYIQENAGFEPENTNEAQIEFFSADDDSPYGARALHDVSATVTTRND